MILVRIISGTNIRTPHDGRYVVSWDSNVAYGTCAVTSTDDVRKARKFASPTEVFNEYAAISIVQPRRPDGGWNRPLRGLHIELIQA